MVLEYHQDGTSPQSETASGEEGSCPCKTGRMDWSKVGPSLPSSFCPHPSLLGKGSEQKATELVPKTQRTRDFAETEMGRKMGDRNAEVPSAEKKEVKNPARRESSES